MNTPWHRLALALGLAWAGALCCGCDAAPAAKREECAPSCQDSSLPITDSGADAVADAQADAAVEQCVRETIELPLTSFQGTRIPLTSFCNDACPTLASFDAQHVCEAVDDGDAGDAPGFDPLDDPFMLRTEGCGTVAYDSKPQAWPRHFHFDIETGALIGAAALDDVFVTMPGTTCEDAAYVGGTVKPACTNVTIERCR